MNGELAKGKVVRGEMGSGEQPCRDNKELSVVAKKHKNTIIWCSEFEASDKCLSYVRKNDNLLRMKEVLS